MLKNRIYYALVLLFAGLFFLCFNGYVSLYVFALALSLPLLSLLTALPSLLGAKVDLVLDKERAQKGGSILLAIRARNSLPVPCGRVKARLSVSNSLTGERQAERFDLVPGKEFQIAEQTLSSPLCGMVVCRLDKIRICDPMGLFALPLRGPISKSAFFFPTAHPAGLLLSRNRFSGIEGDRYSGAKPGDDPSELFGLRDYREGDKLSRVHWKLSEKTGHVLVKELSLPLSDQILFLPDLTGSGTDADVVLDVLNTLLLFLARQEAFGRVLFREGISGELRSFEMEQPEDVAPILEAILSIGRSACLSGLSPEELPSGVGHVLCLCHKPDPALLPLLRAVYPSSQLSLLLCGTEDENREKAIPQDLCGAEVLPIPAGGISRALNGFSL